MALPTHEIAKASAGAGTTTSRRTSRGWLRADRGLETYALQAPDSPKLPGLVRSPSGGSLRRRNSAPLQRWWLRDVTHDKSWTEGLYEVVTGLVEVYGYPSSQAPCLGALRAGSRFPGTPEAVAGNSWIRLRTEGRGVPPDLFLLGTDWRGTSVLDSSGCLRAPSPAHHGGDPEGLRLLSPTAEGRRAAAELWVQDNRQYIARVRDMKPHILRSDTLTYSTCVNHKSLQDEGPAQARGRSHHRVSVG